MSNAHSIVVTVLGFILVIGSPILWRKWQVDGLVAIIAFCAGVSLIIHGRC